MCFTQLECITKNIEIVSAKEMLSFTIVSHIEKIHTYVFLYPEKNKQIRKVRNLAIVFTLLQYKNMILERC